jgi:arginyl-tRNA synthetase
MPVFSALRKAGALPDGIRTPRDVGQAIAKALPPNPLVVKTEMAGPGFINVWLSDKVLEDRVNAILNEGLLPPTRKPRSVVIDYSSPNIAKDMHVGHLRSTIIGDALSRILEYVGHKVHRVNHVGDWGTQFGMLIAHLKDTFPEYATTSPDITNLTTLYKEAKVRFDDKTDPEFKTRAYAEVVKLQAGDEVNTRLWKRMVEASAAMFNDVYRRLGVHEGLTLCGESFYNGMIPGVIAKLHAKGLLTEEEGALLLFTEMDKVPLMVRKSDGGFCYGSTDSAAIWYRTQELKADWLIYVIDAGQSLHLKLVFEAARLAGWARPGVHRIDHVSFGIVCGEDKKRFRTRSGDTVRLVDLLDEAKAMMKRQLLERKAEAEALAGEDGGKALADTITDEAEIEATAEAMGYGAVKYFDLRQNRLSDYIFNYDRMLSSDGDTAVYLQYQYARMHSILRKAAARGHDVEGALAKKQVKISHPTEHKLLMQLSTWADAVAEAEVTLNPHVLCKWMYETTGVYSEFQRDCRVLGSAEFDSRVCIVQATIEAVGSAMRVIGIPLVTRL